MNTIWNSYLEYNKKKTIFGRIDDFFCGMAVGYKIYMNSTFQYDLS
jgi:hypothetical protein